MREKKKLRLNVVRVKSFVTALDPEELERVDAGAEPDETDFPCGRSSDRVWACAYTDDPCNTNDTCPVGGCIETTPGTGCGPGTSPV